MKDNMEMARKNNVSNTKYRKLFVGGLGWQTGKDAVRHYFEQFGELEEVVVITDKVTGKSKGYGFVTFKKPDDAAGACRDPSPIINGKKANCKLAYLGVHTKTTKEVTPPLLRTPAYPILPTPPYWPQYSYQWPQYPYTYPYLYPYPYSPYSYPNFYQGSTYSPQNSLLHQSSNKTNAGRNLRTKISIARENAKTKMSTKIREMAKELQVGEAASKNFVFSPSFIQLALSLVANGSNRSTLSELLTFLGAKSLKQLNSDATKQIDSLIRSQLGATGPILSFVGGLWVQKSLTLSSTFKEKAEKGYRAQAKELDFHNDIQGAICEVNTWAEESSNGLIKSILPQNLSSNTVIVLGNAVYFKGTWSQKFDKQCTREYSFYLSDQTEVLLEERIYTRVTVPFMTSRKPQYFTSFKDFKVLRLPYEKNNSDSSLSMYIILPNQVDGIWNLIDMVGSDSSFFDTHICSDNKVVPGDFRIPKFKMTFDFEASDVLQGVGLKKPFSKKAELDEMVPNVKSGDIRISKVFHKAEIEVNEEGTEVAAVTAITTASRRTAFHPPPPLPVNFVADHPFMFVVREDQSGVVLFMGHVMNPLL